MVDEGAADWWAGLAVGNELSGGVSGVSVQAGAIHGDVHVQAAGSPAGVVPRQLIAPSVCFTNRQAELAALGALSSGAAPVFAVLSGPGGVGKTALALRWAHEMQGRFPDGQLYVDLAGFGDGATLDPGEALGCFLRALGVSPERVPVRLDEQAALYRSVTRGRSLLVVLDNAYSAAQVHSPGSDAGRAPTGLDHYPLLWLVR